MSLLSSFVVLSSNKNSSAVTRSKGTSLLTEPSANRPLPVIEALARAQAARDRSTHAHARRVRRYAVALAGEISISEDRTLAAIDAAALLHDIGKLGIPDRLLDKPGPLTREEYDHVKLHAIIGADMLSAVAFPGPLAVIVRHHHENWDGTGYPDGLAGEQIPVASRIIRFADTIDAMTTERPYRAPLTESQVRAEVIRCRATQFDPQIADRLLSSPLWTSIFTSPSVTVTPARPMMALLRKTPNGVQSATKAREA